MSNKKKYDHPPEKAPRKVTAPHFPYLPEPKHASLNIGLIGCGCITDAHLKAYKKAGYSVVALCDISEAQAEQRKREYYPAATIYTDYRKLLQRDDIAVLDISTHPAVRVPIMKAAIRAGKHILSQKPFVLDLNVGRRLVELADEHGVKLAVNQNLRWAPHFNYICQAIESGLIGEVLGAHVAMHWNHDWIAQTPFNKIRHAILYDLAIHWFDIIRFLMGGKPVQSVYATTAKTSGQKTDPPLLAQVVFEFEDAQASLVFDSFTQFGNQETTYVAGAKGSITSIGATFGAQKVTLHTSCGDTVPKLRGNWFPDGFQGAMGELLRAIIEDREPPHSAKDNLKSLELCFAAVASADKKRPVTPGTVRRMP